MSRVSDHITRLYYLLQQPPHKEVWKKLADIFITWPNDLSKVGIDWSAILHYLLQQSPSTDLWEALCNLFIAWPEGSVRSQAILAADQQLETWDNTLRFSSANKRFLYKDGQISELGQLMRYIQMYRVEENSTSLLKSIANSPYLCNLTHLSIYRCEEIYPEAFAALAQSSHLHKLQYLEIHNSDLGMIDLYFNSLNSINIDQMRTLEIIPRRVYFFDLIHSPITANLHWIKLSDLNLLDWYIKELAQADFITKVKHLDLSSNRFKSDSIEILTNNPNLQNLTNLILNNNNITDKAAFYLANSPYLQNLQELHLIDTRIGETGRQALLNAPHLRHTKIIFERSQL